MTPTEFAVKTLYWFFLYGFIGWGVEVVYAAIKTHKLVNRGFLCGPICPIYGFGMVGLIYSVSLIPMPDSGSMSAVAIFFIGMILTTAIELVGGWALFKIYHIRWWDYSNMKFNLGGYICPQFSLLWGLGSVLMIKVVHPLLARGSSPMPFNIMLIVDVVLLVFFVVDVAASTAAAIGLNKYLREIDELRAKLRATSDKLTTVLGTGAMTADTILDEQKQSKAGKTEFTLDSSCKEDLAKIFAEMNPVVRDKQNITHVTYGNRKINYYIKKNKISKKDRKVLKKYVETDCELLCAVVTAAKGFVRESVGDDVSEERVNVISAAYSLVGKVGYFWGGKSTKIGTDPSWGTAEKVSAEGSKSTGTIRAYGLDCSGFVTWAVINGYQDQTMQAAVGDGTSDQWEKANVVTETDAQPGDLVFQKGPEAGSDNHVGILCGKTDAGDWIAVHCSSSKNGVTVGEAYSASFRYIRQPSFYPTEAQLQEMQNSSTAISSGSDIFTADVKVNNTLQDAIKSNTISDGTAILTSGTEEEKTSILPKTIDLSKSDVTIFKAK